MRAPQSCLIVDDNPQWQQVFTTMIERLKIPVVIELLEPSELISEFQRMLPDLTLLNIDGPESVQRLKSLIEASGKRAKIIAISQIAKKETVLECIYGGAFHYIVKNDNLIGIYESLSNAIRHTHFHVEHNSAFKPQQVASFLSRDRKFA